jgi:hypothetical protein
VFDASPLEAQLLRRSQLKIWAHYVSIAFQFTIVMMVIMLFRLAWAPDSTVTTWGIELFLAAVVYGCIKGNLHLGKQLNITTIGIFGDRNSPRTVDHKEFLNFIQHSLNRPNQGQIDDISLAFARQLLHNLTPEQARSLTPEQCNLLTSIVTLDGEEEQHGSIYVRLTNLALKNSLLAFAIHALGVIKGDDAANALISRIRNTRSRRIKARALEALRKIDRNLARSVARERHDTGADTLSVTKPPGILHTLTRLAALFAVLNVAGLLCWQLPGNSLQLVGKILLVCGVLVAIAAILIAVPGIVVQSSRDRDYLRRAYQAARIDDPDALKYMLRQTPFDGGQWPLILLLTSSLYGITAKQSTILTVAQVEVLHRILKTNFNEAGITNASQNSLPWFIVYSLVSSLPYIGNRSTVKTCQQLLRAGEKHPFYSIVAQQLVVLNARLKV